MVITNCKYCNSNNLIFTKTPNLVHYGRMNCNFCKKFNHWVRNTSLPKNLRTSKKTVKEVCLFHGIKNEEICFFCLRNRNQLGAKETLTIDHIQELKANNGDDALHNMQILCSACHKLKNWCRLYMHWHLK